jgi:hypothetical protein
VVLWQKLTEHVSQDACVPEVRRLGWGVDTDDSGELSDVAGVLYLDGHLCRVVVFQAGDAVCLFTCQLQACYRLRGLDCSSTTPIPTRFDRWIRS